VGLRYYLGGDRPSQTAHLTLFPPIHSAGLESNCNKGGISPTTNRTPQGTDQSLPPILRMLQTNPILSCSKGSRGLSVLSRVTGVFTGTTISPSSWLRQCPDRYTIRAGRNLPDKEFRYLRTVIVTAAVYWGFISQLRNKFLTAPFNLPAPGRCHSLYIHLTC
jgi:hypothetical protein